MNRPYIICHMTTSIDGKVTGEFLSHPASADAINVYYQINREYKVDGYACGRVTMQGSFCGNEYPDLSKYSSINEYNDFIVDNLIGFYAVSFDPNGKLGWKSNLIVDPDGDPGYDGAQIIQVLTEKVDKRYLSYLKEKGIPYLFAGENEIDVGLALFKLKNLLGVNTLLLEGGSILDGAFMEVDVIDEISLVVAPVIANTNDKPLFMKSQMAQYSLADVKKYDDGVLWLNYKK